MISTQYKKCLYCGRFNFVNALQCEGCGASSFGPVQTESVPPYLQQPANMPPVRILQIPPPLRILFFLFIGIFAGVYWLLFASICFVTVVAQPLALAMFRTVPTVATLQRNRQPFGAIIAEGWRVSVSRYFAAPVWEKVFALAIIVGSIAGIFFFWYG